LGIRELKGVLGYLSRGVNSRGKGLVPGLGKRLTRVIVKSGQTKKKKIKEWKIREGLTYVARDVDAVSH